MAHSVTPSGAHPIIDTAKDGHNNAAIVAALHRSRRAAKTTAQLYSPGWLPGATPVLRRVGAAVAQNSNLRRRLAGDDGRSQADRDGAKRAHVPEGRQAPADGLDVTSGPKQGHSMPRKFVRIFELLESGS